MSRHIRLPIDASRSFLFCPEHPDEELSYYCLTCEGTCICSECAIRGTHKGHDVQTIRKSYGEVRRRINELMTSLATRGDAVKKILQQIEQHKQEIVDNTRSIKESMKLSFDELREKIRKKEAEFMASAEKFQEDQLADLTQFIGYATQKQAEIVDVMANMKKQSEGNDFVALLNHYGTTKPVAMTLLKETPVDVRLPQVASRRCYLDMDSANRQLEGLSGLHLAIASVQAAYSQAIPVDDMSATQQIQPTTQTPSNVRFSQQGGGMAHPSYSESVPAYPVHLSSGDFQTPPLANPMMQTGIGSAQSSRAYSFHAEPSFAAGSGGGIGTTPPTTTTRTRRGKGERGRP